MLIVSYNRDEKFLSCVPFQFKLDPQLIELDRLLDDSKLLLQVSNDLLRSAPQPLGTDVPPHPPK